MTTQFKANAIKAINAQFSGIEINDYQQSGIDFLIDTETEIRIKFKGYGKYFDYDTHERDVFTVILKSPLHKYRFTFGQSTKESTGTGDNLPTPYDILAALTKYDCGDFDNFCSDFGYDNDSRKAYKTYKAVKREWENVKLLWTPEQIELLQEIQ